MQFLATDERRKNLLKHVERLIEIDKLRNQARLAAGSSNGVTNT